MIECDHSYPAVNRQRKYLFLDTSPLVRLTRDEGTSTLLRPFIEREGFTLALSTMSFMEIQPHKRCWNRVFSFISSVPFAIARNPDKILSAEVQHYPRDIELPIGFLSGDYRLPGKWHELLMKFFMGIKIRRYARNLSRQKENILADIVKNRETFPPEQDGRYSVSQGWLFLEINLLKQLLIFHAAFVNEKRGHEEIKTDCFKSIYVQIMAVFLEYYVQRKEGKPSAVADFLQLSLAPYCQMSVLDNERCDTVQRMNRACDFEWKMNVMTIADLRGRL